MTEDGGDRNTLRLLGLDVGDKRIGVAVSDPTGFLARPVQIYQRQDSTADIQHMADLVEQYEASGLIVGLPRNMNGSEGPQAEKTREFARWLQSRGLSVELWDERLTSVEVERRMTEQRRKKRGVRAHLDAEAAALILQAYLDHVRVRGTS